jgi:hypothetical protein
MVHGHPGKLVNSMADVNLNAPAFGEGAQKPEDLVDGNVPAGAESEETEEVEETPELPVEENKVPYSRFKKFHDEAREFREEAEQQKARADYFEEALRTSKTAEEPAGESSAWDAWKELYGDSEASIKAWKIQQSINESIKKEARQEAIEAVRSERLEESSRVRENINRIESNFEDLSAMLGRDLTEREQSILLDIVDDYTQKDEDGNYMGAILPFDKAWEIYELKQGATEAPKKQSRDNVASLTGSKTHGETNMTAEKDKNFNPLDWDAYKKRV